MNLSQQQIDQLAEYGKALTPLADAALLLGVDEDDLRDEMSEKSSPVRLAYERGRAQTLFEIRQTEVNMAAAGSPLAIQHVKGYVNDIIISND